MTTYYLLYSICTLPPTPPKSLSTLEIIRIYKDMPFELLQDPRVNFANKVLKCVDGNVDYVGLWGLWRYANGGEKTIMELLLPTLRKRIFAILLKAYYTLPSQILRNWLLLTNEDELREFIAGQFGPEAVDERMVDGTVYLRIVKKKVAVGAAPAVKVS
ncbi:hypothetical protein HK097_004316 [Rhizophlyctis rosea]|uniref:SAC3/GANP/THP3 conserved domain-containing protein n=1 Tax=Rhizophlyctis rosea TaxID=64517 RepID=A0AAD5S1F1_9FUNG|nr:hypothetical protein HK097_004316 [Rhizophlyctis rosea]